MLLNIARERVMEIEQQRRLVMAPLFSMGPSKFSEFSNKLSRESNNVLDEISMVNEYIPDLMKNEDKIEVDGTTDRIHVTYLDKIGYFDSESDRSLINHGRIGSLTREEWLSMVNERREFFREDIPEMGKIIYGIDYEDMTPEQRKLTYVMYTKYRTIDNIIKYKDKIRDEIFRKERKAQGAVDSPWRY